MNLSHRIRLALVCAGPILWLIAGWMPIFGGAAKWHYRCGGRHFTGQFDDCFNDYIPVGEIAAVLFTILTIYFFYIFSKRLYGFASAQSREDRYSLNQKPNGAHVAAIAGATWAAWRAFSYPQAFEFTPFIAFWGIFAVWFGLGAAYGWFGREASDNAQ